MIKGKDKIIEFIQMNDASYWTLYPYEKGSGSNTFISRIPDEENVSIDTSIQKLRSTLNFVEPGRYKITVKKKFSDAKGFIEESIETLAEGNEAGTQVASQAISGHLAGYVPVADVEKQISSALEAYDAKIEARKKDERLAEMERKIAEYEKGDFSQTLARIYDRFEPFLDTIIPHVKKNLTKPAIAGANNTTPMGAPKTTEELTQQEEELAQLLQRWESIHPGDPLEVIRAIVEMAETKPMKYATAKSMM